MSRRPLRQGSKDWIAARRELVTGTDIASILGVHPWVSEDDLAAIKGGLEAPPSSLPMRVGTALEGLIASEYAEATGRRVRRLNALWIHPSIPWAGASPDYAVVGERRLLEVKHSSYRGRWSDGLPQYVESQVRWQLGVMRYPVADVAALLGADDLRVYTVEHEEAVFEDLVAVARDFRQRLLEGGPFAHSPESVRRRYPRDDGSTITADAVLEEAAQELLRLRASRQAAADAIEELETAMKTRMADAARLEGEDWYVTWKLGRDRVITDWQNLSAGYLRTLPEDERRAMVGLHSVTLPGNRPFRIIRKGQES